MLEKGFFPFLRHFFIMNFDGTYPGTEKQEKGKLLECQSAERPPDRPPVRVVVSYPASEEWDGKNKYACSGKTLLLGAGILICGLMLGVVGYFIYRAASPADDPFNTFQYATAEGPDDEVLRRYLLKQVFQHYQQKLVTPEKETQLGYFADEYARIQDESLDVFLNDLDLSPPPVLPHDPDLVLSIAESIEKFLYRRKTWLSYLIREETKLASYEFQINRKEQSLLLDLGLPEDRSPEEDQQLELLRSAYNKPPQLINLNGTIMVDGTIIVLSEVVSLLDSLQPQSIQQVLLSSTTIFMDTNLTRNIDLAIFAERWHTFSNITINLSGEHPRENMLYPSDGMPGASGQNGGFFLGVGLSSKDFQAIKVINNGGNGGPGHNGTEGQKGRPGLRPNLKTQRPKCVVPAGDSMHNPAGEDLQLYKVYADGSCGEEGGPGGLAGRPGLGGPSIWFSNDIQDVKWGRNGTEAVNGVRGEDGESAPGCHFVGYQITTYRPEPTPVWSPITVVRCDTEMPPVRKQTAAAIQPSRIPDRSLAEFKEAIDAFSYRARNFLATGNNGKFRLLSILENSPLVANLFNATELFVEYNVLHSTYSNVEIFESFSKKLSLVLQSSSGESKTALQYLQIATYTKLTQLTTTFGEYYIVDIAKYIDNSLDTIKRLDVDVFKTLNNSKTRVEIQEKLQELGYSILRSNITCANGTQGWNTDRAIICLSSSIARTLVIFTDVACKTLTSGSVSSEIFSEVNATISNYTKWKQTHRAGAVSRASLLLAEPLRGQYDAIIEKAFRWNRTATEPTFACAEMMLPIEQCRDDHDVWYRWETYKRQDGEIMTAYQNLDHRDPLQSILSILSAILRNLKESRAQADIWKKYVTEVRRAAGDLSSLVVKSRRAVEEEVMQRRVAQVVGLKIPEDTVLGIAVANTKDLIVTNLLRYYYQKAYFAYQQWAYPYVDTVPLVSTDASKEELIQGVISIKDALSTYQSTIQERDSQIKEAEFILNSSTGPFYTWTNAAHREVILELLRGHVVQLRANLEDSPHVPLKQAIKFRTVELALTGIPHHIQVNFAVEMTHSGFSHFFYNSSTFTSVGPQVKLFYSFDHGKRGDKPSVVNQVYKKIKHGDIILSPFTTWTVQLQVINNKARLGELLKYENVTSAHLVGTGWYTSAYQ